MGPLALGPSGGSGGLRGFGETVFFLRLASLLAPRGGEGGSLRLCKANLACRGRGEGGVARHASASEDVTELPLGSSGEPLAASEWHLGGAVRL